MNACKLSEKKATAFKQKVDCQENQGPGLLFSASAPTFLSLSDILSGSHNISETLAPSSGYKLPWHPLKTASTYSASAGHVPPYLDLIFLMFRNYSLGILLHP